MTEITPPDRLSSDLAFSTAQKAETSVMGAYNALQSADYLSGRALVYIDLLGNDIYDRTNFLAICPDSTCYLMPDLQVAYGMPDIYQLPLPIVQLQD